MARVFGTPLAGVIDGTYDVPLPAGYASGQVVFLLCGHRNAGTVLFAAPSGWSTIVSDRTSTLMGGAVFYRVMDGTEGSTVAVASVGTADCNVFITMLDDEVDGAAMNLVSGTYDDSAVSILTYDILGITAGTAQRLYAWYIASDNDLAGTSGTATGAQAFTEPSGMTEVLDLVTDEGADLSMGLAFEDTVTGATGTRQVVADLQTITNMRVAGILFSVDFDAAGGDFPLDAQPGAFAVTGADAALEHVFQDAAETLRVGRSNLRLA